MSNMSDRDRKILLSVVPVVVLLAYYFLLLAPKRNEATTASAALSKQEQRVTAAQARVDEATQSKTTFAADYTQMVRLGKAIPSATDMPSLIVQLDQAASGTGIRFTKIAMGDATGAGTAAPPAATTDNSTSSTSGSQPPAAAGGAPAQSGPGKAAETAHNASGTSDKTNAKVDSASGGGSNGSTSTTGSSTTGSSTTSSSDSGGTAPSSGTGTSGASGASGTSTAPAGLQTVPLDLEFDGNFFNLADFFHRVKRMVHVANQNVFVSGRLMTIEGIKYTSDPNIFPKLKAELSATIYLSPKAEGTTAGASPQGPSSTTTPASTSGSAPSTPPAATATPQVNR